ncbi:MAG TPA: glycosyltransferase family 4 protein [Malonomonas sp.]
MKILQVTAALNEGGVERGTLEMAAFIVAQGAKSYVASNGGKLVSLLEKSGGEHFLLPLAKRRPWAILGSALQLAKIIRQHEIDLVHARSRAPAWAALIACRITRTPMVTTFHGTHKIQNRLKWFYNSAMVRGERVIAISEFIRAHIIENYQVAPARIDLAPRGFDPEEFNPEDYDRQAVHEMKRKLELEAGVPVITLPGRLTRWKGQTLFLQALGELKDLPWQALLIGGAGKKVAYENELKTLAYHLGIADRVKFLGSRSDIAACYALSDIVVSASTEPEAFGRVAIEAQAMGKPIIASAHGGSLETVKDGLSGWLYSPLSSQDMAAKLRLALSADTDLPATGSAGRRWVVENYTVEQMCQAEWRAYAAVCPSLPTAAENP